MKWSIASSLLCLAAGFFLGHNSSPPPPDLTPPPVTQSKRASRAASPSRPYSPSQNQASNFITPDFSSLSGERGEILEARLRASLTTLSLDEIPEALDYFLEKERREYDNDPPWEASTEMVLLLARWYELEGESVLGWIENHPNWTPESNLKTRCLTVLDGFKRDPQRGLELAMNLIKTSEDILYSGFASDLLYEIGRWSPQPGQMLQILDPDDQFRDDYQPSKMASGFYSGGLSPGSLGFPVNPAYPRSNREMEALARGLIDAGKHDLARQFTRDLEGSAREAFQDALGQEASRSGWQEIKRQIDNGVLDLASGYCSEVLVELAKTDRRAALDWYLNLPATDNISRGDQIAEAVSSSGAFQIELPPSDDPFGDPFAATSETDFTAARNWLNEMQSRGEPIDQAISNLHTRAIQEHDWNVARELHQLLPEEVRHSREQELIKSATNLRNESFLGTQFTWANPENSYRLPGAEAFGLVDQVHAKAREINAQSLTKLRALLERLEAEAAQ